MADKIDPFTLAKNHLFGLLADDPNDWTNRSVISAFALYLTEQYDLGKDISPYLAFKTVEVIHDETFPDYKLLLLLSDGERIFFFVRTSSGEATFCGNYREIEQAVDRRFRETLIDRGTSRRSLSARETMRLRNLLQL